MTALSDPSLSYPALKGLTKFQNPLNYLLPTITYIKGAGREGWSDLSTRWVHGLYVSLICGVGVGLIEFALHVTYTYGTESDAITACCHPDGTFSIYDDYNPWSIVGFFQINVAFGSLTFTQAKVIDTVWDVVVGRVGQSILAFFLWRSIADYATVTLETEPTTYAVFFVLFLQDGPSFSSIYRLLQDFIRHRVLRSKLSTAWILLSMVFVLAWPTLISAMSGYTPEVDAYAQDIDGNLVRLAEFQLLNYIIHDGWRIGLSGDYPVIASPSAVILDDKVKNNPLQYNNDTGCPYEFSSDVNLCYLRHNTSEYTSLFGFNGRNNTRSLWLNEPIPSPSLNIEAFYLAPGLYGYQTSPQYLFGDPVPIERLRAWTYANHTYYLYEMQMRGSCKPPGDTFKWGYSFLQLFILLALLFTWSVGTYWLWAKARSILPPEDQPEHRQGLKALLLLAEISRGELQRHGIDPHSLTKKELEREIHKKLQGGSISFNLHLRNIKIPRRSILRWVARELVWWLLIVGFGVGGFLGGFSYFIFAGGVLLPYCIGRTDKSRIFLAAFSIPASLAIVLLSAEFVTTPLDGWLG